MYVFMFCLLIFYEAAFFVLPMEPWRNPRRIVHSSFLRLMGFYLYPAIKSYVISGGAG